MPDEPMISVLLVEDDRRLATLTREYLERHQLVVTLADDGQRGLELAIFAAMPVSHPSRVS